MNGCLVLEVVAAADEDCWYMPIIRSEIPVLIGDDDTPKGCRYEVVVVGTVFTNGRADGGCVDNENRAF